MIRTSEQTWRAAMAFAERRWFWRSRWTVNEYAWNLRYPPKQVNIQHRAARIIGQGWLLFFLCDTPEDIVTRYDMFMTKRHPKRRYTMDFAKQIGRRLA